MSSSLCFYFIFLSVSDASDTRTPSVMSPYHHISNEVLRDRSIKCSHFNGIHRLSSIVGRENFGDFVHEHRMELMTSDRKSVV